MGREITSWNFTANILYAAERPISLENEFSDYSDIAEDKIKEMFPDVDINIYPHGLRDHIFCNPTFFKIDKKNDTIELDRDKVAKSLMAMNEKTTFLEGIVNYGLDEDIKGELPILMRNAYQEFIAITN